MEKTFSIQTVIKFGWEKLKTHLGFLLLVFVALWAIGLVSGLLVNLAQFLKIIVLVAIAMIISYVVKLLVQIAWATLNLKLADNVEPQWQHLTEKLNVWVKYLAGMILYGIIVFLGFILLVIPGIYFAIKYQFFMYAIIDNPEIALWDAFKKSAALTKGVMWKLVGMYFAFIGVMILGLIALVIGVIPASIVVGIAKARVYRLLEGNTAHVE